MAENRSSLQNLIRFENVLENGGPEEWGAIADDLLLLLNRLHDASIRPPVAGLDDMLHALEADPDGAMRSLEFRRSVLRLLSRFTRRRS